jgi:hypothetical protein
MGFAIVKQSSDSHQFLAGTKVWLQEVFNNDQWLCQDRDGKVNVLDADELEGSLTGFDKE